MNSGKNLIDLWFKYRRFQGNGRISSKYFHPTNHVTQVYCHADSRFDWRWLEKRCWPLGRTPSKLSRWQPLCHISQFLRHASIVVRLLSFTERERGALGNEWISVTKRIISLHFDVESVFSILRRLSCICIGLLLVCISHEWWEWIIVRRLYIQQLSW